jgi:integrase
MAPTSPSRNAFADPSIPTFATLIDQTARDEGLPQRTRQNWIWALRAVARAAGTLPDAIPAHPEFLRALLERAAPASVGIGRAAWNNARSLLGKTLRRAGLAALPGHYQAPFSAEWGELWARLPAGTALAFQLARLFHYASANAIGPSDVDDEVLGRFYRDLCAESIVRRPYEIYRGAVRSWNNAAERIAGWPQQRLSIPSRRRIFSAPWSAFPASLNADIEAYLRRAAEPDLSDDHFTRAQRPRTIETRRNQLRFFATAIVKSGIDPDLLVNIRAMLMPEMAARGLQHLVERNNGASGVQISNLADFLPTLAGRLDVPEDIVRKLRRIAGKLKVRQQGMTTRNREALRAFDDPKAVEALVNLPQSILREMRASGRRGHREARVVQTALAIELLLNAPLRIQNLASIHLDRHILETGSDRNRSVHLYFPAAEVKNANDLEFPLMAETVEFLEIYLAEWRPLLTTGESRFLFPGKSADRSKGNGALSSQIKQLAHAYTRLDLPAHRYRHAVGKIFLDRNPGQYEIIRLLLGHKDIRTTVGFYAGAEGANAARHYAKTILRIRGGDLGVEAPHG